MWKTCQLMYNEATYERSVMSLATPIDSTTNPTILKCFECYPKPGSTFRGRKALEAHLSGHGAIKPPKKGS